MALGFKITVEKSGEAGAKVTIRWLKGHDSVLFESFCGMVKRKFEEAVK
jgi:23S rRNA (adenine1618-N6)-methyltransferase